MATDIPEWAREAPAPQAVPAWASAPPEAAPAWATAPAAPVAPPNNPDANVRKFLNFLGKAEGADYNTVVGGGQFTDFRAHPRIVGLRTAEGPSTAAGKYQIVGTTYDDVAPKLGIRDFSPDSQDKIAVELIRRKGALDDVRNGNFDAAIGKLGGTWASLPSSPYSQPKRSAEWAAKELNLPVDTNFKGFAPVRKDIDPKSLNADQDWLKASMLMYQFWERKPYEGTQDDLAEWGKDSLGNFNYNLVSMAEIANALRNASQDEKEAFLYMMDTYDNTNISWEGTGRAFKGIFTDPMTVVGVGTLGIGFAGKAAGKQAIKQGLRKIVIDSMARTGIAAGVEGAVFSAADSSIRQGVEVSAGRRSEISLSKIGVDATIGAVAGVVLGTAADAALTGIIKGVKGIRADTPGVPSEATRIDPVLSEVISGVTPPVEAKVAPEASANPLDLIQRQQDGRLPADEVMPAGTQEAKNLPIVENKAKEKFYDTRNSGERFHGSSSEIASVTDDYALSGDSRNIYGQGFYTTDAVDISNGYMKKGKGGNPTLYKIEEINSPKMYNMEEALPDDLKKQAEVIFGDLYRTENGETGKPITNMRELFDEIRAESRNEGYSRDDVQEMFDSMRSTLEQRGFNGYEHVGGANTGNTAHNVKIYWTPEQHIKSTKVDIGDYRPKGKIEVPEMNTGLRTTRVNGEDVAKLGKQELADQADVVVRQLRDVETKDLPTVLESLRTREDLSREEIRIVDKGIQNYKNEVVTELAAARTERLALDAKVNLTDVEIAKHQQLEARIADLEERYAGAVKADDATGSMAGSILQDRQDPMNALKGVTVESIMTERGVTKAEAEQVWAEMVGKANLESEGQKISAAYDAKATTALENDDLAGAAMAAVQKHRELDAKITALAPKASSFIDKLGEFFISNVFSIKTIIVNLIPSGLKTLVIPGLKAILNNPFEKATRVEAAASYSAMRSSFGGAMKAAAAGFRYEQAILTRDGTRLVEGELAMKGKLAGAWRIFPRILNASDEFLSKLNYDSFIAGRAAAEAAIEGTEKGMKGKVLDDFIDTASKKALDDAMRPTTGDELVSPIINKGLNLGLTGDDLFKYVEREAVRDPQALRKGNDDEALNFVRDVLYKRKFSGENGASKAAQWYEDGMKKFPSIKLVVGQLFFRTPVRVFEEGIRLTPGIQFLAPGFLKDLQGANGPLRQVRAQAEAMTSLVVASGVLSLYAQGRITGDGAYSDYKQQKNRVDGPQAEPYTIKMADGSTWSYRGFDPIATPVKIMINALERMDKLRIREAQGEFVDKSFYKEPLALISVGVMSIATAIRDASLVEGASNFSKFVKTAFNPEEGESAFIKALGDKLFLLVPNTLHKIARDNDPQIRDPVTFWQMVEQKLLRPVGMDEGKTAFAYDVLGNVRKSNDTGALWNVFSTASVEERAKGLTEKEQFVMTEMDRLARTTGFIAKPPIKHPDFGDTDMRTIMAADGKRTIYDVWQQNYKAQNPVDPLYDVLSSQAPEGTFKYAGVKEETVRKIISDYQNNAFAITMSQEQKVMDKFISETLLKAKSNAGLFSTPRPY